MYWIQSLPVFSVSTTMASMFLFNTFVMATAYLNTMVIVTGFLFFTYEIFSIKFDLFSKFQSSPANDGQFWKIVHDEIVFDEKQNLLSKLLITYNRLFSSKFPWESAVINYWPIFHIITGSFTVALPSAYF